LKKCRWDSARSYAQILESIRNPLHRTHPDSQTNVTLPLTFIKNQSTQKQFQIQKYTNTVGVKCAAKSGVIMHRFGHQLMDFKIISKGNKTKKRIL
jgi:hypothetical protein